jgi:hypothetical protein
MAAFEAAFSQGECTFARDLKCRFGLSMGLTDNGYFCNNRKNRNWLAI